MEKPCICTRGKESACSRRHPFFSLLAFCCFGALWCICRTEGYSVHSIQCPLDPDRMQSCIIDHQIPIHRHITIQNATAFSSSYTVFFPTAMRCLVISTLFNLVVCIFSLSLWTRLYTTPRLSLYLPRLILSFSLIVLHACCCRMKRRRL
jgi:hypothetical protein